MRKLTAAILDFWPCDAGDPDMARSPPGFVNRHPKGPQIHCQNECTFRCARALWAGPGVYIHIKLGVGGKKNSLFKLGQHVSILLNNYGIKTAQHQ